MTWTDEIYFDEDGLVPVIVQNAKTERVLMFAWANREALECTVATGKGVYFSKSRGQIWVKGASSGNEQHVVGMQLDVGGEAVIYRVDQVGGVACHTGHASTFWRELRSGGWVESEPVLRDPQEMYHQSSL